MLWLPSQWCLKEPTAKWLYAHHQEPLSSLVGNKSPTTCGWYVVQNTGGTLPMPPPFLNTSRRMVTGLLAWGRYFIQEVPVVKMISHSYPWSLPYFHGEDKVHSPNAWCSFDNISDSDLQDGQIADHAVEVLKEIKQNHTKGDNTPFFVATGFHKPHLPLRSCHDSPF